MSKVKVAVRVRPFNKRGETRAPFFYQYNLNITSLSSYVEIGMGTKCVIDMEGNQTILDSQRCSLIRNMLF